MSKEISRYFSKPDLTKARKRVGENIEFKKYILENSYKELGAGKHYIIQTYGCQGNEADSETIKGILEQLNFTETDDYAKADIILLNTCAVRENAENRIWGELGRLKSYKKTNPNLILGVCGCMPQEEVVVTKLLSKYPYVDLIFGTHNIYKLPEYIKHSYYAQEKVVEVVSGEGSIVENLPKKRDITHKAFVNIMFGCDEFCTYCIVPYTRGRERSRKPSEIVEEIKTLVQNGCKEVTLLGQNVNAYGNDLKDGYTFANLLKDISDTNIERIRFTTSHPRDLTDETIECFSLPNVMPHLHLPVQSGNDAILKKMNRKYTKSDYLTLVEKLNRVCPSISLTTDIIVGFPTETEEQFEDTLDLVTKAKFEGAFTFVYSKREGTPAAKLEDDLSEELKKERLYKLNDLINEGFKSGNEKFRDMTVKVLVDGVSKGNENRLSGYSEHNKLVNFDGTIDLVGQIVEVKIIDCKTWSLVGELVG